MVVIQAAADKDKQKTKTKSDLGVSREVSSVISRKFGPLLSCYTLFHQTALVLIPKFIMTPKFIMNLTN